LVKIYFFVQVDRQTYSMMIFQLKEKSLKRNKTLMKQKLPPSTWKRITLSRLIALAQNAL